MQLFEGHDLPRLSPEIWHIILKLATRVPGLVDTSQLRPLSDERRSFSPINNYNLKWRTIALPKPMPFILVCRQWYGLAIEFVYEFVWISSAGSLVSLAGTFQRDTVSETIRRLRQHHLGYYVKSLWLNPFIWDDTSKEAAALNTLFNFCEDLQILRFWSAVVGDTPAIVDRCSSLRAVRMDWGGHPKVSHFCLSLLNKLHHFSVLESLELSLHPFGFPDEPMSFPRLHTFTFDFAETFVHNVVMTRLAAWSLPALRSLTIASRRNTDNAPLESFLRTHGRVLTSFKMKHGTVDCVLPLIGKYCTSLQNLGIEFSILRRGSEVLPPTPHLARVQIMDDNVSFDEPEWFFNAMETIIVAKRPSLRRVQLADVSYDSLRRNLDSTSFARWDNWADKLRKEGIRFDDRRCLWGDSRGDNLDYYSDEFDPSNTLFDLMVSDERDDILSEGEEDM